MKFVRSVDHAGIQIHKKVMRVSSQYWPVVVGLAILYMVVVTLSAIWFLPDSLALLGGDNTMFNAEIYQHSVGNYFELPGLGTHRAYDPTRALIDGNILIDHFSVIHPFLITPFYAINPSPVTFALVWGVYVIVGGSIGIIVLSRSLDLKREYMGSLLLLFLFPIAAAKFGSHYYLFPKGYPDLLGMVAWFFIIAALMSRRWTLAVILIRHPDSHQGN